ncbi:MAG: TlpA disulfide reductase family protein [Clostridia bacterium]|nr:TlpA disulfide reductase family protein [Clostridia bacterium]
MKKLTLILLCLLLVAAFGCTSRQSGEGETLPTPTQKAADPTAEPIEPTPAPNEPTQPPASTVALSFSSEDQNGSIIDESYLEDKSVVMLNFWATWCGPCISELPALQRLYEDYAEQGFAIIGVLVDGTVDDASQLIESNGITYPVIVLDGDLLTMAMGYQYVPTTVFVDGNGNALGEEYVGSNDYSTWAAVVEGLLN